MKDLPKSWIRGLGLLNKANTSEIEVLQGKTFSSLCLIYTTQSTNCAIGQRWESKCFNLPHDHYSYA